jgi:RNA polymerase sigma-70 factor (ECF subfamily)
VDHVTAAEGGAVGARRSIHSSSRHGTTGDDRVAEEFATWVEPHLPAMARLASRLVPEADRDDVVQEALVRAWRRRATYDADRGAVGTWLLAIVAGCARRSRVRAPRDHPADPLTARHRDPVRAGPDADRDLDLERAVRGLPARERLAVALYYFLDLDIADTAAVMGCSTGTVKATLAHARTRLRTHLEGGQ